MGNPAGGFMSPICFTNGALEREHIRKKHQVSREVFDDLCVQTVPGNHGEFLLPWFEPGSMPLQLKLLHEDT